VQIENVDNQFVVG